jgi:hypothetical protein
MWLNLRYDPGNSLDGQKIHEYLSQNGRCLSRDSKRKPAEYKSKSFPLEPTYTALVNYVYET